MLAVAYANKKLRELCESQDSADRELGAEVAARLRHRIADLYASDFVAEIVKGEPQNSGRHRDRYTIDLGGWLLVLAVNQRQVPRTKEDQIDWAGVSRAKIVSIEKAP